MPSMLRPAPLILLLMMILLANAARAATTWDFIRVAPDSSGLTWQEIPCAAGTGWRLCEPPLGLTLTASPASIAGTGGTVSTITAVVRDALGNLVEAGVQVDWVATRGTLSAATTNTNSIGQATVVLTSSKELAAATVTATAVEEGGSGSISISFIDSWVSYSPTYTVWANSGSIYGCANWSPDPSTVNSGVVFTQTATDCEQDQVRQRQDYEISEVTGATRASGAPVTESRVLTDQTDTRAAVGTKVMIVEECSFTNSPNNFWRLGNGQFSVMTLVLNGSAVSGSGAIYSSGGYVYYPGKYTSLIYLGAKVDNYQQYFETCRIQAPAAGQACYYDSNNYFRSGTSNGCADNAKDGIGGPLNPYLGAGFMINGKWYPSTSNPGASIGSLKGVTSYPVINGCRGPKSSGGEDYDIPVFGYQVCY